MTKKPEGRTQQRVRSKPCKLADAAKKIACDVDDLLRLGEEGAATLTTYMRNRPVLQVAISEEGDAHQLPGRRFRYSGYAELSNEHVAEIRCRGKCVIDEWPNDKKLRGCSLFVADGSEPIVVESQHLYIATEELDRARELLAVAEPDEEPLGERVKESLLATIAALAKTIAAMAPAKYGPQDAPKYTAIGSKVLEVNPNVHGLGRSSIDERIAAGLKVLRKRGKK
ncbi:MAG: hypothetical protein WC931_06085 [Bacilli bacterium]|jgi:hypothetical protein